MAEGLWLPAGPQLRVFEGGAVPTLPLPSGLMPFGMFLAAAPVLADRQAHQLRLTADARLMVDTSGGAGPTSVTQAPLTASGVTTGDAQVVAAAAGLVIGAFTVQETGGATATLTLHNGNSAAGPVIAYINLAANQWMGGDWGGNLIDVANGVWLETLTGTVNLVAFTRA